MTLQNRSLTPGAKMDLVVKTDEVVLGHQHLVHSFRPAGRAPWMMEAVRIAGHSLKL